MVVLFIFYLCKLLRALAVVQLCGIQLCGTAVFIFIVTVRTFLDIQLLTQLFDSISINPAI